MILNLFSHRIYREKGIVSIGDTGGLPTGAGEHPVTKHGGRSQYGFSIQKRDRAFQATGASQGGGPMPTPDLHHTAAKVATMLAFHCVRNSSLEDLHAGIFPSSKTGDYTDVKVVSPYGEIAWNRLGRISDEEMKRLSQDIMNRLYTFLFYLLTNGEPDRGMPLPTHWAPPHLEASIAEMWPEGRASARDAHKA